MRRLLRHRAARPALVLSVIAAVSLAVGRPVAAVAAVVAIPLLVQSTLLSPRFVAFVDQRFGPGVARAVAFVLLAPVYFLVLVPVTLLGRLLGTDPLGGPGWHERPVTADRTRRPFGPDRANRAHTGVSWRVGLALLATGAMVATLVPRVFDEDPDTIPDRLQGGGGFDAMASPALADAEWADQAATEFGETTAAGSTYTPYVSASLRDYQGRYVNITDRQRDTYTPEFAEGADPIDVWFFGGSTMFGYAAQRDQHTIPSEVVRLAEADDVAIRARNFGAPGYVNFQETVLLAQLLLAGEQPDLVVFYDGINDVAVQVQHAYGGLGRLGDLSDLAAPTMRRLLAGTLTGSDEPPDNPFPVVDPGRPPSSADIAEGTASAYGQGVELARTLADRYDFEVVHYWQPTMYTKDRLVDGEQELLEPLHLDEFRFDAFVDLSAATAAALPAGVVDLADALDGRQEPILNDQVHTNELGARLVAEAIYADLVPRLADGD